jgi:hypothetical protein
MMTKSFVCSDKILKIGLYRWSKHLISVEFINYTMQSTEPNRIDFSSLTKGDEIFDLVKVKVRFEEHYYIFSRFLIIRMLTLCRVRKLDAIKISKAIKKQLIERNKLEVSQAEL